MIDTVRQLGLVARRVEDREVDGKHATAVVLEQTFPTDIDDLWDVLTNAERIPRWFLPITGDLRLNGTYQLEGNAGGTITACDAPRSFDATWEFGGGVSWIEVRLWPAAADQTSVSLAHIAHPEEHWKTYGPGATGVGWDGGFLGLAIHLDSGSNAPVESEEWMVGEEGKAFYRASGELWIAADIASGTPAEEATTRGLATIGFYTGTTPS